MSGKKEVVDASVAADTTAPIYSDAVTIGRGTVLRSSSPAPTGPRSLLGAVRRMAAAAHASLIPMTLFVVNDPTSGVDEPRFDRAVLALATQIQRDVAPEYELPPPVIVPAKHGNAIPKSTADGPVAVLALVGKIPSNPEDEGWHQPLGTGEPFDGYISTEGLDFDATTECMGHEFIETLCDPMCVKLYVAADGSKYPEEPCDACQAGGPNPNAMRVPIDLHDGQEVVYGPNWCTRAWGKVGDTSGAKKDFLGLLPTGVDFPIGPFGYAAKQNADGTETDVFGHDGEKVVLPAHKQHPEAKIQVRLETMRAAA